MKRKPCITGIKRGTGGEKTEGFDKKVMGRLNLRVYKKRHVGWRVQIRND